MRNSLNETSIPETLNEGSDAVTVRKAKIYTSCCLFACSASNSDSVQPMPLYAKLAFGLLICALVTIIVLFAVYPLPPESLQQAGQWFGPFGTAGM